MCCIVNLFGLKCTLISFFFHAVCNFEEHCSMDMYQVKWNEKTVSLSVEVKASEHLFNLSHHCNLFISLSVHNRCVIEVFLWRLCVVTLLFGFSVGVGAFDIGLSQISSFFSCNHYLRWMSCWRSFVWTQPSCKERKKVKITKLYILAHRWIRVHNILI